MHIVTLKHIGASVLTFLLVHVILGRTSLCWVSGGFGPRGQGPLTAFGMHFDVSHKCNY